MFEYDVFLSFASEDEKFAHPIWHKLSSSGLRVFWSNETLKESVGQAFFNKIQDSLMKSQYFILLCSDAAFRSKWVNLEYTTFFSECYIKSSESRRLILMSIRDFNTKNIPPFLGNFQIAKSIEEILPVIGGIDIPSLLMEYECLKEELTVARKTIEDLSRTKELKEKSISNVLLRLETENRARANENEVLKGELALSHIRVRELEKIIKKPKISVNKRLVENISVDETYDGVVVEIDQFGAFVTLKEGAVGFIHISQISQTRPQNIGEQLSKGDMVNVRVLNIDDEGRVVLSMRGL